MASIRGDNEFVSRPLGPAERVFHFYDLAHPCVFSVTAQLTLDPGLPRLRAAVDLVAASHPLLRAFPRHDPVTGEAHWSGVDRSVQVTEDSDGLEDLLAREQVHLFDPAQDLLWRVTLHRGPGLDADAGAVCAVVLSFDHRLLDGMGALAVVRDLMAVLNGADLPEHPMPAAQERLPRPAAQAVPQGPSPAEIDARMSKPATNRPWDGVPPTVQLRRLSADRTAELVASAREQRVSVQALLTVAAAVVLARRGDPFVRVIHPVDLRRILGWGNDEAALRLMLPPARTGLDAGPYIDRRRAAAAVHNDLLEQTSETTASTRVAGLEAVAPSDPDSATAGMLAISGMDAMITNLGAVPEMPGGDVECVALDGPTMTFQVDGEIVVGVVTYRGRMHIAATTREPIQGLLDDMIDELVAHT